MIEKISVAFESFLANLAAIFRHIVPGCLAFAFAWLSHPSWFPQDLEKVSYIQIWIAVGILLLVGNVIFVLHRTLVHQLIDWAVSGQWRPSNYVRVVAKMIEKHFAVNDEVRKLMRLKNSQIILTAIFGELCIAASIWKEQHSRAESHVLLLWIGGVLALVGAGLAHAISHHAEKILPD